MTGSFSVSAVLVFLLCGNPNPRPCANFRDAILVEIYNVRVFYELAADSFGEKFSIDTYATEQAYKDPLFCTVAAYFANDFTRLSYFSSDLFLGGALGFYPL